MAEKTFEKNVGGIWLRKDKNDKTWLSLSLEIDGEKKSFVAFKNDKGDNPNRPDYQIFPSKNKDEVKKPVAKVAAKPVEKPVEDEITL